MLRPMSTADTQTRARALARARKEGRVLRSRDLSTALSLVVACGWGLWFASGLPAGLAALMQAGLAAAADPRVGARGGWPSLAQGLSPGHWPALVSVLTSVVGLLVMLALAALGSMLLQSFIGGGTVSRDALGFRPRAPIRLGFGDSPALSLLWSVVKAAVLVLVLGQLFLRHTPGLVEGMSGTPGELMGRLSSLAQRGAQQVVWVALLFAGLDVLVQRQREVARLAVDPWQERRRRRAEEGDPRVRGRLAARMGRSHGEGRP